MKGERVCRNCGWRFVGRTPEERWSQAEEARGLIKRLISQRGGIGPAAKAFSQRYGRDYAGTRRRFARLLAGQKSVQDFNIIDELQVML